MTSTLYELHIKTKTWHKRWPKPTNNRNSTSSSTSSSSTSPPPAFSPRPRYFHSATAHRNKLVIFGGQSHPAPSPHKRHPTQQLDTLSDLVVYDITTDEWYAPAVTCAAGVERPVGRYAHLAVVSEVAGEEARLTVLGGQDDKNKYLDERFVLDLGRMEWVAAGALGRSVGTYRSSAAVAEWSVDPSKLDRGATSRRPIRDDHEPVLIFTNAGGAQ